MDKYSQRNKGKLVKKGLRLFEGDSEVIDEFFPKAGHNVIVRLLVRDFVKKLQANFNQKELPNAIRELTIEGSGEGESS